MERNLPTIVVIGATYVDIVLKCNESPAPGKMVTGSTMSYTVTGPGVNQAAEAAFCGCKVQLVSKIGGCPLAKLVTESLHRHKISTEYLFTAEAKNTGSVVTFVTAEGENESCLYAGANNALGPQDIQTAEQAIAEADVCLIHGSLSHDTISTAIRYAKLHNVKIILDPAGPISATRRQSVRNHYLPMDFFNADIMIPNLYEAADLTEHSPVDIRNAKLIGSELIARGVQTAVITIGKRGCMVVDRKGADHIPAFDINLVDQTCTGDAFAGALAACCAVDDNVRQAVKFASAAGALACTKFGSVESLPTKAEIIQLLQQEDM